MSKDTIEAFEKRTAAFIRKENLLHSHAPVVVALSGGADSVALLAVLSRLGYDCRAAHCNFHLRGEESQRDMRHACAVCDKLGTDIYIRDFDVEARRRGTGESVEMACRTLRYAWFDDLLDRASAQAVAVGHHREDRVETFMLNLLRGTGLAGLTSMKARRGNVVRPLLSFSRHEIEEYLASLGLSYVEDSSNLSDAHRRNRLRNHILPLIEELFPGAEDAILTTIGNLESADNIYRQAIKDKTNVYLTEAGIDLTALAHEKEATSLLFEILKPLGFKHSQVCDMLATPEASGIRFFSTDGDTLAELNRGTLELVSASRIATGEQYSVDPRHDITEPVLITVSRGNIADFRSEGVKPSVAFFDAAIVDDKATWVLRHPRRGDKIVPFGSHKPKLLSDIFNNAKYSAAQKRNAWVLTRNGIIVWLPGLRNSATGTISPGAKEYVRMEIKL